MVLGIALLSAGVSQNLVVLRNLAAHGRAGEVTTQGAVEYDTLTEAVIFAILGRRAGGPR